MAKPDSTARARLEALREQGAAQIDPVHFRYMEALLARSEGLEAAVRRRVNDRLESALRACQSRVDAASSPRPCADGTSRPRPLQALLAYIGRLSHPPGCVPDGPAHVAHEAGELKSVAIFRDTWLSLSVTQELNAALARAPDNAGPLNSHILVLQAMEMMRDIAPEYLQHFITHVDGLLWLEHAASTGKPAQKSGPGDRLRKPAAKTRRKPAPDRGG